MTSAPTARPSIRRPSRNFPPTWYADPWGVAPLRWWDGHQWTPILYGPYGEAWPLPVATQPPFVAKGPGIKGGGIAAVGAGVGFAATIVVVIAFGVTTSWSDGTPNSPVVPPGQPVGHYGSAVVLSVPSHSPRLRNGTGNLTIDYGLAVPRWKDAWLGLTGGIVGSKSCRRSFLCSTWCLMAGSAIRTAPLPSFLGITHRRGRSVGSLLSC